MMNVNEMKTQVINAKDKVLGGEVTLAKKDFILVISISVLVGVVLGLYKGMKVCTKKKKESLIKRIAGFWFKLFKMIVGGIIK